MEQLSGRGRGRGKSPYGCRTATPGEVDDRPTPRSRGRPRRITLEENCANPQVYPAENLVPIPIQSAPPKDAITPINPCCLKHKGYCENYTNFLKSRLPQRLLFFANDGWVDLPERARDELIRGFRAAKSGNIVMITGTRYLVDFVNMVIINLENSIQKSIAWIDEANKCFFPKFVIDGGSKARIGMEQIIEQYSGGRSNMLMPQNGNKNLTYTEITVIPDDDDDDEDVLVVSSEPMVDNGGPSQPVPLTSSSDSLLSQTLEEVDKSSEYYFEVQNSFLSGIGSFVHPGCILGIYQYNPVGTRKSAFLQQVKRTRKCRGHSNVRRAWFGASKQGINNIILHGFGTFMNGVHLNSEGNSYLSKTNNVKKPQVRERCTFGNDSDVGHEESRRYSDVPEPVITNTQRKYIILCKVIMGRMEIIKPGSNQWHPSSDAFDSGVDNLVDPKTYVIWGAHVNLHIQPECVINFHLPKISRDYLAGLNTNDVMDGALQFTQQAYVWSDFLVHTLQLPPEEVPLSPRISVLKLFATARGMIAHVHRNILDNLFHDFRCKIINKDQLLMKMKETLGDQLLTILKKMENM